MILIELAFVSESDSESESESEGERLHIEWPYFALL